MATRYYITFHSSTYDTTKRYSSCLQILSKDNLVAIGQDIALKIPMSCSLETSLAQISPFEMYGLGSGQYSKQRQGWICDAG